jgi:hypothetical protein
VEKPVKQTRMNSYILMVLWYSSGLILAAAAGLARFKYIDPQYRPFIFYLWLGIVNEAVSYYCGKWFKTNVANNNIFFLAEFLLLNLQFKKWDTHARHTKWYRWAGWFFLALFISGVVWKGIQQDLFYFNVLYCLYLVLCATRLLATIVASPEKPFAKDARFIICGAGIIYFSYRIIIETFLYYGLQKSILFRQDVHEVLLWINLLVNFMYLYAIIWMQKKPGYITWYG